MLPTLSRLVHYLRVRTWAYKILDLAQSSLSRYMGSNNHTRNSNVFIVKKAKVFEICGNWKDRAKVTMKHLLDFNFTQQEKKVFHFYNLYSRLADICSRFCLLQSLTPMLHHFHHLLVTRTNKLERMTLQPFRAWPFILGLEHELRNRGVPRSCSTHVGSDIICIY